MSRVAIVSSILLLIVTTVGVSWSVDVSAHGRVYAHYGYVVSDPDPTMEGYSEFAITRAYFTLKAEFIENAEAPFKLRAKATLDVANLAKFLTGEVTAKTTSIAYLKYAYGEIGNFNFMPGDLYFRFGQQPTPYIGYENKLWKFRYVGKVLSDHTKYLNSADLGLCVGYKFPKKLGDIQAIYMNGEGYKTIEVNKFKDFGVRLSVFPLSTLGWGYLSDLGVHVYYQKGKPADNQVRDRILAGGSYKFKGIGFMGQYLATKDGSSSTPIKGKGYSTWLWVDLGKFLTKSKSFGIIGKYDKMDPDTATANDAETYIIGGGYYNFTKNWALALDYQVEKPENTAIDSTGTLYLHFLGKY